MITDFTPGAYMVHDMLHMRGGHQVNWFLDGIPVVNTSIAANVAPLVNPKNVDELEVERGGFSSEYGDRTYGFFNVVTPSGFERNNEAELIASAGNFWTTDDQFNIGGHTQRFAYYASVDANRSELGLATPISQVIHDQASGVGGFLSLMYNATPKDQLRWIVSLRGDHYQIPNTPDQQAAGIRDLDLERDYLGVFTGCTRFPTACCSPFRRTIISIRRTMWAGRRIRRSFWTTTTGRTISACGPVLQVQKGKHNARVGTGRVGQRDNSFFRPDWQSRWRIAATAGDHIGRIQRAVHRRSVSRDIVADPRSRSAVNALRRPGERERGRSARGRRDSHSRTQLGPARLLRILLSAAAAR